MGKDMLDVSWAGCRKIVFFIIVGLLCAGGVVVYANYFYEPPLMVKIQNNHSEKFTFDGQKYKLTYRNQDEDCYLSDTDYPNIKCLLSESISKDVGYDVCFHTGVCLKFSVLEIDVKQIKILVFR